MWDPRTDPEGRAGRQEGEEGHGASPPPDVQASSQGAAADGGHDETTPLSPVAYKIRVAPLLLDARLLHAAPAQGDLEPQEQLWKKQRLGAGSSRYHTSLDPVETLQQPPEVDSWSCILSWERVVGDSRDIRGLELKVDGVGQ